MGITSLFITFFYYSVNAQETEYLEEQLLESLDASEESNLEDDTRQQELEQFARHRLNINAVDAAALASSLRDLALLSDVQIDNLLRYRQMLGPLRSVYELQAVPAWDLATIRRLLPFVKVETALPVKDDLLSRIRKGNHNFVVRAARQTNRDEAAKAYAGDDLKLFIRYRYSYKNLLQFGFAGEKDAGEKLFRKSYPYGLDFTSFHLFGRQLGPFKSIAFGDFTVNFGQGLIQWQGLAFKKNSDAMLIKRQSATFKPYNSAGEFNFYRGFSFTIGTAKNELSAFFSTRRLSATVMNDTISGTRTVSSLVSSGYHRTESELAGQDQVRHTVAGLSVLGRGRHYQIGAQGVFHHFSIPLRKRDEPYNLFAVRGRHWGNMSVDYSWNWKNIHFFGESAIDRLMHRAAIAGILLSPDTHVDLSLLYRNISPAYQAINASAFTENTAVSNENGLFFGTTIKPVSGLKVDLYFDVYQFPWLKFQSDAPGGGKDIMLQLNYSPNRQSSISSRFRYEVKQANAQLPSPIRLPELYSKQSWRTQVNMTMDRSTAIRYRLELSRYHPNGGPAQNGYLLFFDLLYHPALRPWSLVFRAQYFDTDGYDARIYAFENDVLYSNSIPAFDGNGYRLYLILSHSLTKHLSCWLRCAQTFIPTDVESESAGPELKFQFRFLL